MPSQKSSNSGAAISPERASRARQRQRLIDACISALHIHGPSRTTVEKVVAIAQMSPGIVRFYFDSKDAMLVASLAYLAAEFEERVMTPVSQLLDTPVRALEQLVDLYLDPDVASPRKVSVWYSFWGEASSRQEYLEICGRKDDEFAALVRDLIERMIVQSGESHLDPDGVALGLIGVLEVLWQGFAFTDEAQIDRRAAKQRSLAYLRSVFPGQFGVVRPPLPSTSEVPAWAYSDSALLALERDRLFRPSWQLVGHDADIPRPGDFLTVDLAGERVLVVRDGEGKIRAFRNSCRKRPHALVSARRGNLSAAIQCEIHGLSYGLDGALRTGKTRGDLTPLELALPGRMVLVRAAGLGSLVPPPADWFSVSDLRPNGVSDLDVSADWKLMVEQWLEALPRPKGIRRSFLPPNQLLEVGPTGVLILQVIPESPGTCRIRRLDYAVIPATGARKGAAPKKSKVDGPVPVLAWLQQDIEVAESTQIGLAAGASEAEDSGPVSPALAEFRRRWRQVVASAPAGG